MKYICLGYYDKSKHDAMTEAEKQAMFDACFTYDDHLRANAHWVGGEPIQPAETALTLYWKNGKVATTAPTPKPRNNSAAFSTRAEELTKDTTPESKLQSLAKTRLALGAGEIAHRSIASMRLVRSINTCLIQNIKPSSGVGS